MKRRNLLKMAAPAFLLGTAGCIGNAIPGNENASPKFAFAGVIVESLPTAEEHLPLEVTVRIEQDSEVRYEETHTVEDVVNDVAFKITKEWMNERVPYGVTVSSPVHEPNTYSTKRLEQDDQRGKFSDRSVYFGFQLTANTIIFRPIPEN